MSVGKKIVNKLLSQPHKFVHHGKLKNTIEGSNQRLTAWLNTSNFPMPNTVYGAWTGSKHLANWDVVHLRTPMEELYPQLGIVELW